MEAETTLKCNSDNSSAYVAELNDLMNSHNFMLCYKGDFSQSMTKSILAMAEKKMNNLGEDLSVKKKVFNVLVECLQNISKNKESVIAEKDAMLMLGKVDDYYEIYSGNIVDKSKKDSLEKTLELISNSDKEEIKSIHKSLMLDSQIFNESSIEMALIDIAKKTGNKIEYKFMELDAYTSFLSLRTTITKA